MNAEIESLQKYLANAHREIGQLKQAESEQAEYYGRVIADGRQRIAELEESLQRERAMAFSKIQRQRHAIANLCRAKRERGKALVEERARFNSIIGAIPANQCKFPEQDLSKAREQLRVEGKI